MCKKFLVTGATGLLGRYIVGLLVEKGEDVRVLVDPEADKSVLDGMNVEICEGEIFQKESMRKFFNFDDIDPRACVLIHADERISISKQKDLSMRRTNVSGTINITDLCLKHKIGRLVYISSAYALASSSEGYVSGTKFHFDRNKVEGDYAQTKAEASAYIMEKVSLNKLNAVLVLPTFMIGPGIDQKSDVGRALNGYLHNSVVPVRGGHVFVDVRDVAAGVIAAAEKGETGAGYILTGEYRSTIEFFDDVCAAAGIENNTKLLPNWVLNKSVAKFVDTYYKLAHKDNPKDVYSLFTTSPDTQYSIEDTTGIFNPNPKAIKETIIETVSWVEGRRTIETEPVAEAEAEVEVEENRA